LVETGINHKHVIDTCLLNSDSSVYDSQRLCWRMMTMWLNADKLIIGNYNLLYTHIGTIIIITCNTCIYCHMNEQANVMLHYFNEFNFYRYNNIINVTNYALDFVFLQYFRIFSIKDFMYLRLLFHTHTHTFDYCNISVSVSQLNYFPNPNFRMEVKFQTVKLWEY